MVEAVGADGSSACDRPVVAVVRWNLKLDVGYPREGG